MIFVSQMDFSYIYSISGRLRVFILPPTKVIQFYDSNEELFVYVLHSILLVRE